MRHQKYWSVRSLLYSLTAAAVLPASVLLSLAVWNQYKTDELEAARSAYNLAQLTANHLEERLTDARHVLETLARRPGVRSGSADGCDPIFGQFKDLYPQFSNLSRADLRGYIVCSAMPQPQGSPTFVGNAVWYQRLSSSRRFTMGPPYRGPVSGRMVVVLAQPLFDDAGRITGSLQMPIDLVKLRVVVGAEKLPASTVIAVFDSSGVVVARSRDANGVVGKNLSDTPGVQTLLAVKDGTGRTVTSDGIDRIIGFLPVPGTEWFAVAGIDTDVVLLSARQSAVRNLLFGGLTLLLVLVLAVNVGKRISRPMAAVQDAARRATAGDYDTRVPISGPLEVVDFADQFNRMLDAIRFSQTKLADARSELVLLGTCMSHLTDMVIIMDGAHAASDWPPIVFVNDAFEAVTGYRRDEVLGSPGSLLHGPNTSSEAIARIRKGFRSQAPFREELVHYTRSGEQFWVELDMIPIRNQGGQLTHWVSIERDVTLRKEAEQRIHRLAYYDVLTGLPNRSTLMQAIDIALQAASRDGQLGAVLFVDLDHFKNVNDARGHAVGDAFLQAVALRIAAAVQRPHMLARLGGDEFVILLSGMSSDAQACCAIAMAEARSVCEALAQAFDVGGQAYVSTASIGVTMLRGAGESAHDLLRESDTAMYRAKKRGRNHIAFFTPDMQAEVELRLALEHELTSAMANGELRLDVQTQFDREGRPAGAECLLRWQHPTRGRIAPIQFIPVAEETGLIVGIGAWVLEQACLAMAAVGKAGNLLPVSVNVSPRQFHQPGFVDLVKDVLDRTGAPANQLILEVTESMLIDDLDEAIARMNELAALGIRFSIDDFGTGYSSMAYLRRLPLHELKIDKSFVRDTPHDADATAIVKSILSMARHLNLKVVAEGVETVEQAHFLASNHCDLMQGYLYARPEASERWLSRLLTPDGEPGAPADAPDGACAVSRHA